MIDERMLSYYPEVVKAIYEIQAIVQAEYPEFELQADSLWGLIDEAYITTMGEERIKQWEELLGIQPSSKATIEDRREVILARVRGNGKLNTDSIQAIVTTFTKGKAYSWVEDSVLHVEILPPKKDKTYIFENVVRELNKRVPAHIGISVKRKYSTWGDIKRDFSSWNQVEQECELWFDVSIYIPLSYYDN